MPKIIQGLTYPHPLLYSPDVNPSSGISNATIQEDWMTSAEVIVTLLGVGAIGWVNWYFFAGTTEAASQRKHDHHGE
jgi:hypothetical protein